MRLRKVIIIPLLGLALFTLLLSSCSSSEKTTNNYYYLLLMGESETWRLSGYEVMITSESFKAGNGTLMMKNTDEYMTDYIKFSTYAVINEKDIVVHSSSASGPGINVAMKTTGTIDGGTYLNKDGEPITLQEVSSMYMLVEWMDRDQNVKVEERIDLFSKGANENSFLN